MSKKVFLVLAIVCFMLNTTTIKTEEIRQNVGNSTEIGVYARVVEETHTGWTDITFIPPESKTSYVEKR